MRTTKLGTVGVITVLSIGTANAEVRYAHSDGATSGQCAGGWGNACALGRALDRAASGDQVWVKAGTYGPITLKDGVKLIGGFAGTEAVASGSDPAANPTVIDGGGRRGVTSNGNGAGTVLRGFVIRNGDDDSIDGGGGMRIVGGSPKIVSCIFERNNATYWGGAVTVVEGASPQFVNCTFRDNGDPSGQRPFGGGAVHIKHASPVFVNCLFHDNRAGGGAALANDSGRPTVINCTFARNRAHVTYGGAIHDEGGRAVIRNSIVWDNAAETDGDQLWNLPGAGTVVSFSDVQGGWSGEGNQDRDPRFTDAAAGDFSLASDSPCRNAGRYEALPADEADLDWDGDVAEKLPLGRSSAVAKNTVDMGVCASRPR